MQICHLLLLILNPVAERTLHFADFVALKLNYIIFTFVSCMDVIKNLPYLLNF